MERWQIEQKDMKDGRCKDCEKCRGITANGGFSFFGCYHSPYNGKWVAEIKDCPKNS